jgi:hypothetical protein
MSIAERNTVSRAFFAPFAPFARITSLPRRLADRDQLTTLAAEIAEENKISPRWAGPRAASGDWFSIGACVMLHPQSAPSALSLFRTRTISRIPLVFLRDFSAGSAILAVEHSVFLTWRRV